MLLEGAFTATVAGGDADTGLEGILVKFEVSDKTSAGGNLVFTEGGGSGGILGDPSGILVDPSNKQIWDAGRNERVTTGGGKRLYIRTGGNGAQGLMRETTRNQQNHYQVLRKHYMREPMQRVRQRLLTSLGLSRASGLSLVVLA